LIELSAATHVAIVAHDDGLKGDDISGSHMSDPGAHRQNSAHPFVSQDSAFLRDLGRSRAADVAGLGIRFRDVKIGAAQAGIDHGDPNLIRVKLAQVPVLDLQSRMSVDLVGRAMRQSRHRI
jgi:hypothetical protein